VCLCIQIIQHKLAELKTEICVGRAFVDAVNKIHNDTKLDSQMASMAKYWYYTLPLSSCGGREGVL